MNEVECDVCNRDVPEMSTIDGVEQHWGVEGLDVICYNCVIQVIGANVSKETLRRLKDR